MILSALALSLRMSVYRYRLHRIFILMSLLLEDFFRRAPRRIAGVSAYLFPYSMSPSVFAKHASLVSLSERKRDTRTGVTAYAPFASFLRAISRNCLMSVISEGMLTVFWSLARDEDEIGATVRCYCQVNGQSQVRYAPAKIQLWAQYSGPTISSRKRVVLASRAGCVRGLTTALRSEAYQAVQALSLHASGC